MKLHLDTSELEFQMLVILGQCGSEDLEVDCFENGVRVLSTIPPNPAFAHGLVLDCLFSANSQWRPPIFVSFPQPADT